MSRRDLEDRTFLKCLQLFGGLGRLRKEGPPLQRRLHGVKAPLATIPGPVRTVVHALGDEEPIRVVPCAVVALAYLRDVKRLVVVEGPALAESTDLLACVHRDRFERMHQRRRVLVASGDEEAQKQDCDACSHAVYLCSLFGSWQGCRL